MNIDQITSKKKQDKTLSLDQSDEQPTEENPEQNQHHNDAGSNSSHMVAEDPNQKGQFQTPIKGKETTILDKKGNNLQKTDEWEISIKDIEQLIPNYMKQQKNRPKQMMMCRY